MADTLAAALSYAAHGWRVFRLKPRSKSPVRKPGHHAATTNPETIRRWWSDLPSANIGHVPSPDVQVVDVDGLAGRATIAGMSLPETVIAETGGGGWHYYYRLPADVTARNTSETGLPGVHLKGAPGGYLVAPPSVHPDTGRRYEWAPGRGPGEVAIAPAPTWLLELLTAKPKPKPETRRDDVPTMKTGETIPDGTRNARLTSIAGTLRDIGFGLDEITDALLLANARCTPPKPEAEVRRIARSVAGYAAGPVRIDRRLLNADLSDGALRLAALLTDGVPEAEIAEVLRASASSVKRWWRELREAGLEEIARTRPTRRFVTVPRGALLDSTLPTAAKVTLLHLACYMKNGRAQVPQEQLGKRRKRHPVNVGEDLRALRAAGYLLFGTCHFDRTLGRRMAPNTYRWPTSEMAERDNGLTREAPAEAREAPARITRTALQADSGHQDCVKTEATERPPPAVPESLPLPERVVLPQGPQTTHGAAKAASVVPRARAASDDLLPGVREAQWQADRMEADCMRVDLNSLAGAPVVSVETCYRALIEHGGDRHAAQDALVRQLEELFSREEARTL